MIYLIGLHFGLRARKEHRQLRFGKNSQIQLLSDPDSGKMFLRYTEDCTKTRSGGLRDGVIEAKCVDRFESDSPRNIVKIYNLYISHRPKTGKNVHHFYLQPLENPTSEKWFKDQAVGENKLGEYIKSLFADANIEGFYTNHSLRRTKISRLFQGGAKKEDIKKETGHSSDSGLLAYRELSVTEKRRFQQLCQEESCGATSSVEITEGKKVVIKRTTEFSDEEEDDKYKKKICLTTSWGTTKIDP